MKRTFLLLFLLCILVPSLRADLPSVRFDRLTPLGGAAGNTVEVEIAGADIEDVKTLLFDHPGLKATFMQERRFRVSIAPDVPAGTYDARLSGRFGVSNPRLFSVSLGLVDVARMEPKDGAPQQVPVNSAVNGLSGGNRDDVFRITAKKGQRLTISCQAGKLNSAMDANLILSTAAGKPLLSNGDYHGRDPFLDFVAPDDGDYLITVHDLTYRGGLPYRLVISDRPQVENIFPRAVQTGKPATVSVFGRNLVTKEKPSKWKLFDLTLDEGRVEVTAPADILTLGAFRFTDHPTDYSVLPTAATCTLTGFQVLGQPVVVCDIPVTLEQEPNDTPEKAQKITLPAVVSGRFDRPRDADWFEFDVKDAGAYSFDVYCERIGGRADPYLVLTDAKGNRIAEMDDFGHRINAFDGHLRDPSGQQNLAAKTTYRVLVQDRYQRGGARYQYVLAIRKAEPELFAAAIHSQNPGPAGLTVRRGGSAYLDVILHYTGGFSGPVTLTAEGLPTGVRVVPTTVRGTHGVLVFHANDSAAEFTGTVKVFATAKVGEKSLRREVRPYTRVWSEANIATSRPTRELALAVRDSAPFALSFEPERLEIEPGKKVAVKVKLQRLWPDFKGKVGLMPVALPGNVRLAGGEIAEGGNEVSLNVEVQGGPGEYTLTMLGQAQVPFSKDPKATTKPPTLVTLPTRPLTLVVIEPKKKTP